VKAARSFRAAILIFAAIVVGYIISLVAEMLEEAHTTAKPTR
jgi:hypothetical protein